jgi:hypothetical protein
MLEKQSSEVFCHPLQATGPAAGHEQTAPNACMLLLLMLEKQQH